MDFISEELQQYLDTHSAQEPELLQQLNRETHQKVLLPRMLSGAYQGRILALLSKLTRPKNILEIGTYTGYASLCLAEGMAKDGLLDTIDCNEGASGFITLEISGGVEPFDVDWSSGHQSQNLNDILPGLYVVTITDDNGCSVEDSITVVANTNLEVLSEVLPTDCPNGFEGSISLDVVGGQEPYTVQWSTGNDGLALINL